MTEAAMTDDREAREREEIRAGLLKLAVSEVRRGSMTKDRAADRLARLGWGAWSEALDAINAALREGGDREE